jgi:hypothetical protein
MEKKIVKSVNKKKSTKVKIYYFMSQKSGKKKAIFLLKILHLPGGGSLKDQVKFLENEILRKK